MLNLIYLFTGLIVGAVASWLIAKSLFSKNTGIDPVLFQETDKRNAILSQQLEDAKKHLVAEQQELIQLRERITVLSTDKASIESDYKSIQEKLMEHRKEFETLQVQMKEQFQSIASEVVLKNSQRIQEEHRDKLNDILTPFKDKIEKFESQVKTSHEERIRENQSMKEQLSQLQTLNKTIGDEAKNLVSALKGQSKTQGNWGEMILEKVLERSGLTKGREYVIQSSMVSEDGRRLQPDVVINLPENRNLVIDSKVSLIAYERYSSSEDALKEAALKEHISSVRKHIRDLSSKNYQQLYDINTLDFVLLFIPIEPAFALVIEHDSELFNEAFERNIVLVTTSTLLATLRTIASIWRLEYQNKNSLEIARQAGELYDKFAALVEDMIAVGKKLDEAKGSYQLSMNKLHEGRGNLVSKVENLKRLGLKTSKQINRKVLDRTEDLDLTDEQLIIEPESPES